MRTVLVILSLVLLTSCSGSKFYNKISSKEYYYSRLLDKRHEVILKKYEGIAVDTKHIIYFHIPVGDIGSPRFSGLIFDVDNNKYYSIENITGKPQDSTVEEVIFKGFDYRYYIISKYLEGKIGYLTWLGATLPPSEGVAVYTLYDINLEKKALKYEFYEIAFEGEIPYFETEEGKQMLKDSKIPFYQD